MVKSGKFENNFTNVSGLVGGIYLVRINNSETVVKIIKNNSIRLKEFKNNSIL